MKTYCWMLLLACWWINANAQSDVTTSKWVQQPVVADGESNEWQQPLNFYDDKTKLLFAIANDSSNMYFCFESKDPLNQMKLMRAGMKITLTSKGKIKREATIEFPMPQKQQVAQNNGDNYSIQNHADNNGSSPYTH